MSHERSSPARGFHRFDEIQRCLEQVLATSIADETEVVWYERRRGCVTTEGAPAEGAPAEGAPAERSAGALEDPRLSVLVRVVEAGRQGWFRTDTAAANLLESGVRQALALAKTRPAMKKRPVLLAEGDELRAPRQLFDREVSRLDLAAAREALEALCGGDEGARLSWNDARLMIANSHGLRRSAAFTEVTGTFRAGTGAGAGYAAGSSRRLADLDLEAIRDRAREVRGEGEVEAPPSEPVPVLLSPEATVVWIDLLNAHAFSGRAFLEGSSFLVRHRNIQVFDRNFNLRDDGTSHGLPFPFDFEGALKRPLDLIVEGRPSTPALNRAQGFEAELEPTAQAVGGEDALFSNLFLLPGEASDEELLAAADGGLRVGWLEATECHEPSQLKVRMVARGVRRIEGGRLGARVPDLVWEESLLGALARLRAIGVRPVVLAAPTTPLGGIEAPALVLESATGLRPRAASDSPAAADPS